MTARVGCLLVLMPLAWAGCHDGGGLRVAANVATAQIPAPKPRANRSTGPVASGLLLSWDQPVPEAADLPKYFYIVHVDGRRRTLSDVDCIRKQQVLACTGRLPVLRPGPHQIELVASYRGVESPKSNTLSVIAPALPVLTENASRAITEPDAGVCLEDSRICFDVEEVGSAAGRITAWAPADNRAVFVVEDGRRILLGRRGTTSPATVFTLERNAARIVSVAAARDFTTSGVVFLGVADRGARGEEFSIVRHRLADTALREASTMTSGVRIPVGAVVPLTADADGNVYAALPDGSVVRISARGHAGAKDEIETQVVGRGYALPAALIWDDQHRLLWLAGADARGARSKVAAIPIERGEGRREIDLPDDAGKNVATLAVAPRGRNSPGLVVVSDNGPFQLVFRGNGQLRAANPLRFTLPDRVVMLAPALPDAIWVVTQISRAGSDRYRVLYLESQRSRRRLPPGR